MAGNENSSRPKIALPDLQKTANDQANAIKELKDKCKKLEEQSDILEKEFLECAEQCSEKECEYIKKFIASDVRRAQAEFILPLKRPRLSSPPDVNLDRDTNLSENGFTHPAVDFVYQKAQEVVKSEKSVLQQSYDDLLAWKFNSDSASGRHLITCFRQLLERNKSLGAINENDSLSKLESETQVQNSCIQDCIKTSRDFNAALSETAVDMEGVQNSLFALKKQLIKAENLVAALKAEYEKLNPGQSDALIAATVATFSQPALEDEEEGQGDDADEQQEPEEEAVE